MNLIQMIVRDVILSTQRTPSCLREHQSKNNGEVERKRGQGRSRRRRQGTAGRPLSSPDRPTGLQEGEEALQGGQAPA